MAFSLYLLGFVAQGFFGARSLVQWIQSEREGKVVSPTLFWVFSLIGSTLFLVYGLLRSDIVIIVGQVLSYYIYARNLYLKRVLQKQHRFAQFVLLTIPLLLLTISFSQRTDFTFLSVESLTETFLLIGAIGQLSLNLRYLYQWYFSERAKESILPLGFWIISAVGSLLVIVYGFFRNDPVLLVSQSLGMIVYIRNIILHLRRNPVIEKSQVA